MKENPITPHQHAFRLFFIVYLGGAFANDGDEYTGFLQQKLSNHGQWPRGSQRSQAWQGHEDLDQELEQGPRLGFKRNNVAVDPGLPVHKLRTNSTKHEQANVVSLKDQNEVLTSQVDKLKVEIRKLSTGKELASDDATENIQSTQKEKEKLKWSAAKADGDAKEMKEQVDQLSVTLRVINEEGARLQEEKKRLQIGIGEVAETLKATMGKLSDH